MSRNDPNQTSTLLTQTLEDYVPKPLRKTWNFFNDRIEPETFEAYELTSPPETSRLSAFFTKISIMTIKGATEGVYNFDQFTATPVRTAIAILSISAAISTGVAFLTVSSLATLPIAFPVLIATLVVPAALLIIGSAIRAARVKAKDPISALRRLFSEEEITKLPTIEIPETEDKKTKAFLFASAVRKTEKGYFLTAYCETRADSTRTYLSNIALTKEEYDDYFSLAEDVKEKKRLAWLNEKAKSGLTALFARQEAEKAERNQIAQLGYFKSRWVKIRKAITNHYANMSRLQAIREALWVPFKFVFGGAMIYWLVWITAAVAGSGFLNIGTAEEFLLPFGSMGIAFGIPLAIAVVLALARAYIAYKQRNDPKNTEELKVAAEVLFQNAAAEKLAQEELAKAEIDSDRATALVTTRIANHPFKLVAQSPLRRRWNNFWYSIVILFKTDYSIRNMLASTYTGAVFRVSVNTILRFATGFILAFIALWPLFDFGVAPTVSMALLATLTTIQFKVALLSAVCFSSYSAFKQGGEEYKRISSLKGLNNNSAVRDELLKLEDYLLKQRKEVANLEKQAKSIIANKVNAEVLKLQTAANLNSLQRWFSYSQYAHQARLNLHLSANVVAHDEWEFMGKYNIKEKSITIKIWTGLKRAFDRINEIIAAAGSAGLLVRLTLVASALGLVVGGQFVIGPSLYIAFGVFGACWTIIRLAKLLDSKNVRAAKVFVDRGPEAAKQTMLAEAKILLAREARLSNFLGKNIKEFNFPTSIPTAELPPEVVLGSNQLPQPTVIMNVDNKPINGSLSSSTEIPPITSPKAHAANPSTSTLTEVGMFRPASVNSSPLIDPTSAPMPVY
ncbi:MAG TPA: hypothetical protein VD770_05595 [Coxiellaceae bacterium]|nr:hypothetical protein [Coxiellaceae bacterium]